MLFKTLPKQIFLSVISLLLGWLMLFCMVIGVIPASYIISILGYMFSLFGVVLGVDVALNVALSNKK